jgi:hypothetical protein
VPSFVTAKNTAAGASPKCIAVGDFNGDGKLDVATGNSTFFSSALYVQLGNGDGTFQAPALIGQDCGPVAIAVADLNHDGKLDLAVADQHNQSLDVFLGNGNGTFQSPVNYAIGTYPEGVAVGDFNGDGKLDLAVPAADNNLNILLGNGNGTFAAPAKVSVSSTSLDSVAVGDFNGDGKLDVVTADSTSFGVIYVLLGNGDGTFQTPVAYGGGGAPGAVTVADFNGDHKLDLVALNEAGSTVGVLLGNGNGTFKPVKTYTCTSEPANFGGLTVADVNGDGRPDILTANGQDGNNSVGVLLNNRNGTFAAPLLYVADNDPIAVATGDFNGDGKLDMVVANFNSSDVSVLFGRGNGTFVAARSYVVSGATTVAAGDFNGDGLSDLAVTNPIFDTVSIFINNGDGTFALATKLPGSLSQANDVVAADFNGDGKIDLAVSTTDAHGGAVAVFLGNGNGTFKKAIVSDAGAASGGIGITDLAVGDFNGDGKEDIVGANGTSNAIEVLLGNGNGSFGAATTISVGSSPNAVAVADVNGDGKPDLAVLDNTGQSDGNDLVDILLGNGNGTFGAPTSYEVGNAPTDLAAADLNNDGHPDLVVSNTGSSAGHVDVLLNKGDGTFAKAKGYVPGTVAVGVAVGDVTGDGSPDIVPLSDHYSDMVSVLVGNGNGTFRAPVNYAVGDGPSAAAIGNFNGDSLLDLAVADRGAGTMTVFLDAVDKDLVVTAPSSTTAGNSFSITVTAEDASGKTLTGYTGTVHFSSTDPDATLPADYTFVSGDHGVHTFTGVILGKAGNRIILAADPSAPGSAGSATVQVKAGAVTQFGITAPKTATAGTAFTITVMAEDAFGNLVSGYRGTVAFTSSDGSAVLPGNYTFVAGDHGKHTFSVTLNTAGGQTITAEDTVHNTIKGTATVKVNGPGGRFALGGDAGADPSGADTAFVG